MTGLKRRLVIGIATGALFFNGLAPLAFADTTIQISGNGSSSNNTANVTMEQSTVVVQSNIANITNNVNADAKTGGNDAEDNTGGDVSIDTGNASVTANVTNMVNSNQADVDCCAAGNTTVLISGNGTDSDNDATLSQENETAIFQENLADVRNNVNADAKTGGNDAEDNTGGDVSIDTGNASVNVTLSTFANANVAKVGSGNGNAGDLSLKILDNGSNSDNNIDLDVESSVVVLQDNHATINNNVDADAKTGGNDAEDNTGGDVSIDTGDADVDVSVDNMVNFNWADVDCGGCLFDELLAKIDGNGTDSDNDIDASLSFNEDGCEKNEEECSGNFQENLAGLNNNLYDVDAKTGHNDVEDNTAENGGDPSVETGDADVDVDVENSGNVNVIGDEPSFNLPDFDWDFSISLNFNNFLAFLGLFS